jgi:hypothetical protein
MLCLLVQLNKNDRLEFWFDLDCILDLLNLNRKTVPQKYYIELSQNLEVYDEIKKDLSWSQRWNAKSTFIDEDQLIQLALDSGSGRAIYAIRFLIDLRHEIILQVKNDLRRSQDALTALDPINNQIIHSLISERDMWKGKAETAHELVGILYANPNEEETSVPEETNH